MVHVKARFHLESITDVALRFWGRNLELLRRPHLCQIVILLKQDLFTYKEIPSKNHRNRPRTNPPGYVGMLSAASCPRLRPWENREFGEG